MGHSEFFDSNDYELNPDSKKGVMIIHGFSSTTYETLPLAKFLSQKGFRVSNRNLPGHGTTLEDCNATKYQEWLNFWHKWLNFWHNWLNLTSYAKI